MTAGGSTLKHMGDLKTLSEWVETLSPHYDAAARLIGFKDFNHYMQVCEMLALANAKKPPPSV